MDCTLGKSHRWPQRLLTILRLPPGLLTVRFEGGDNIFYSVINGVVDWVIRSPGVTFETLLLILQQDKKRSVQQGQDERVKGSVRNSDTCTDLKMTNNAVRLFSPHATCGWSLQVLLSSNQQVSRCWVTATMCTAVAVVRFLTNGSSQDWKREGGTGNEIQWTGNSSTERVNLIEHPFTKFCWQLKSRLKLVT